MAEYKGYSVHTCPRSPGWGGYLNGVPWFTGKTAKEVREKIDAALAEVPEPSFEDAYSSPKFADIPAARRNKTDMP